MKKLIVAMIVASAAIIANSATVSWSSGAMKTALDEKGGWSTTGIGTQASAYVFVLSADQYSTFKNAYSSANNMSAVYSAYAKGELGTAAASGTSARTSVATLTTNADVGADVYAAIIYTYTDSTLGKDFYIANIAANNVGSDGGLLIQNLATHYFGDASGTATGGWQVVGGNVPEPTSGLLVLVGLAGLALRRKRA